MRIRLTAPAALALLVSLVGCDSGNGTWELNSSTGASSSTGGSAIQVRITDAPFPYDTIRRAVVAIRRVELRGADGRFHPIVEFGPGGREVDLVPLRNGVTELLGEADPPAGLYDVVRVVLEARELLIEDAGALRRFTDFLNDSLETTIDAHLERPIEITPDTVKGLLLDLDLARSFVLQGRDAIDGFRFAPILRAINEHHAGGLTFRVKSDAGTPDDTTDDGFLLGAEFTLTARDDEVAGGGASGTDPDDARRIGFVAHRALPAGEYRLEVAARDHEPFDRLIQIIEGERTDLGTITLARRGVAIRGMVTTTIETLDDGPITIAVPFARVEATYPASDAVLAKDRTNARGAFEITGLEHGDYVVRVDQIGFETAEVGAIVADDVPEVDVVLTPKTGELNGTVRDAAGNVQPRVTVRVDTPLGGTWRGVAEATTDLDGRYALTLPTGVYRVVAASEAGRAHRWLVFVGGGEAREFGLTTR